MRKVLLLTILTLLTTFTETIAQKGRTPEQIARAMKNASFRQKFDAANDLFYQKKYYHALQVFKNLVEEQPDNAHVNYKLGVCYLNSGNERTKALPYLEKARTGISKSFDPYSHLEKRAPKDVLYHLAQAYHLDYQFDKAMELFNLFKGEVSKKHTWVDDADLQITQCTIGKDMVANPDSDNITITNMGEAINSPYSDFGPVLSLDGNVMYFTSRRLRSDSSNMGVFNIENGKHFEDIYVSYKSRDGQWSEPRLMSVSEEDRSESTIGVSADGMELFVYLGSMNNGDIYYTSFEDTAFSELDEMGSNINSKDWETHATISPHGDVLFFVSDRKGGFGGRDIYFCKRLPDGQWGLAQNAGPGINTKYDEDAPYFAADGRTLYFSSNGEKSMGGFDVFVTTKDDNDQWVTPVNMGYPINTVDDDLFFIVSADGLTGYYSSLHEEKVEGENHGKDSGFGEEDIYKVEFKATDIINVAVLKGFIIPAKGQPIPNSMEIYVYNLTKGTDAEGPYRPRKDDGGYVVVLEPCHQYRVEYMLDGELFTDTEFEVPCEASYQEIEREIYLDNIVVGKDTPVVAEGSMLRWKVIDSPVDLKGNMVNYYGEDGAIAGSCKINDDLIFEYENKGHDNIKRFQIDGMMGLVCKDVCVALLDNEDNIIGYAIRKEDCVFEHESLGPKWQLVDAQGNPIDQSNVKVIFKDENGNTSFEEKLGCNGMFAYHALNTKKGGMFELENLGPGLCEGAKIVLLDEHNQVVGETIRDEKCRFKYGEKAIDLPCDTKKAYYEKFYQYNARDISKDEANFKNFIKDLGNLIQCNGVARVEITSSASYVPTKTFKSNSELARFRATDAEERLKEAAQAAGLDVTKINIIAMDAKVLGPKYKGDFDTNRAVYEQYQYVKIKAR